MKQTQCYNNCIYCHKINNRYTDSCCHIKNTKFNLFGKNIYTCLLNANPNNNCNFYTKEKRI